MYFSSANNYTYNIGPFYGKLFLPVKTILSQEASMIFFLSHKYYMIGILPIRRTTQNNQSSFNHKFKKSNQYNFIS